ncbi:MAG: hypothetical protein NTU62_06720 [Spirochaetes bacterium]|nr:hypothetical protein [Spirochaetota bacterium]
MAAVAGRGSFEVAPCVVRSGETVEIVIRPLAEGAAFSPGFKYAVTYTPMEDQGGYSAFGTRHEPAFRVTGGELRITHRFDGEQEHGLFVEELRSSERIPVLDARVYSVDADLYDRRPLKGDLHIHSNRSDGREPPAHVAAACRRIGLDFMAITDHRLYEPSLEAQAAFAAHPVDLAIFPGEEVHPPDNNIHIVNFGGSRSVNAQFTAPGWRQEVDEIARGLTGLPPKLDPYLYASTLWTFRAIHECGGLGIFCHPYWISDRRYHIPGSLADRVFEEQPYDAFELIGGYHRHEAESNALQAARYHEETRRGKRIPVVGVSDAHGCERGELFGWYFTIVFAASPALRDLVAAIKDLWSVAVEALSGAPVQVHGPMRLVKYAHFLLREFFPGHDALCRQEGEAMLALLAGDGSAQDALASLHGRTLELHRRRAAAGCP